jgi:hypothetical protein
MGAPLGTHGALIHPKTERENWKNIISVHLVLSARWKECVEWMNNGMNME